MNQRIAAVTTARNEANFIGRTLSAFFGQHTRPSRVIMVNDGATDRTAAVAAATGAEVVDMPDRGATRMERKTRERSPILMPSMEDTYKELISRYCNQPVIFYGIETNKAIR